MYRFETFTVDIHNIIEKEGRDAFYVFDCLSELQIRWATDLMMGNFFRVTCPFLFILEKGIKTQRELIVMVLYKEKLVHIGTVIQSICEFKVEKEPE